MPGQRPSISLAFDEDWFLSLMKMEKLKRKDIAQAMCIDATLLTNTIKGRRRLKAEEAAVLSTLFKVPVSEVYFRAGLNDDGTPNLARGVKIVPPPPPEKLVSSVKLVSSYHDAKGEWRHKRRTVQPRVFLTRSEVMQLVCQVGGELDYPNGLGKGLHYRMPSDRLEVLANTIASWQLEHLEDALLHLRKLNPDIELQDLFEVLKTEALKLPKVAFKMPVYPEDKED